MMQAGPILETVLYADDIAAAQGFYGGVLGLDEYRSVPDRFSFYRCGGQMLLVFNPAFSRAQSGDGPPAHGTDGAGHVCFRASRDEQEDWKSRFAARGVRIEKTMVWPGGGCSFYVRDPAGNSVEFAEAAIWKL